MSNAPRARVKPNWGEDDSQAPILHVDMDSFFASVELVEDPQLRGRPVVVGGTSNRGVVTSATYEARALGVRSGQPLARARRLCPQAAFLPVRHDLYRDYSRRVMEVLAQITPVVEKISIDEAFLDVSGARRRLGSPLQIAALIRQEIRDQVGITASVGIAANKSVAKIASAHAKPDGVLLIPASRTVEFLHTLPVWAIWGVGRRTQERLAEKGITTVEELAKADPQWLQQLLGVAAATSLHELAWGIDRRKVGEGQPEKSISVERTFEQNLTSRLQVEDFLYWASEKCASRLRRSGYAAWTVHLKLREANFATYSRSVRLSVPTDLTKQIAQAALGAFAEVVLPVGGYRLLGVGVSNLVSRQMGVPVALDEDPRDLDTERVIDRVRAKFGDKAVTRARLLKRRE